ncbi:unnamed protein product [Leptosia nina]|uniref:Peptidase C31 domain-containing protein n=1 Tax=Leptosia nina TaxID=320188 RepID=A0AAV1J074_9NEOP
MVSRQNVDDLLRYTNTEVFVYGTISWQKFVAKKNTNTIYLYKFTCKTERNLAIAASPEAADLFKHRQVVGHADDLFYFFPAGPEVDMNSETFQIIDRATTLWTNFAKYGNPTPDNSLGVSWKPYTLEEEDYLDLGNTLEAKTAPEREEIELWESVFREYYPHVAPLNNTNHLFSTIIFDISVTLRRHFAEYGRRREAGAELASVKGFVRTETDVCRTLVVKTTECGMRRRRRRDKLPYHFTGRKPRVDREPTRICRLIGLMPFARLT